MRLLVLLLLLPFAGFSQAVLIPQPVNYEWQDGSFTLPNKCTYFFSTKSTQSAAILDLFSKEVANQFKIQLSTGTNAASSAITIFLKSSGTKIVPAYDLSVSDKGIKITASNEEGLFYATRTLLQLMAQQENGSQQLPYVHIEDFPRFEYRGMHLDVGRHFFPTSFIKKYIDWLSYHKLNKFHWHLTEDQGWRVEIKKYPALTQVGAWRNGTIIGRYPGKGNDNQYYGGFYTQQEIREVVAYAQERFVEVIPEIEMPGHSSAAIAAYPYLSCFPDKPTAIPPTMVAAKSIEEQKKGRVKLVQETWGVFDDVFCAGKESTFAFLEDVLDEIIPLFPSTYVHIGGDECPKTHWKICPLCQKRITELGLKDEHELQSYFVQRIEKYLNSKGKRLIGWDEILEGGLAPNAIVMSWRGEAGGIDAAKQGHQVIMTPGNPVYFDHTQRLNEDSVTIGGFNPIDKVYAYNPIPTEIPPANANLVMGAQANVWTEYMNNQKKVEYMIFPRIAALSEVLWTPIEKKNWTEFEKKLPLLMRRYESWGVTVNPGYFDIAGKTTSLPSKQGVELSLNCAAKDGQLKWKSPIAGYYQGPVTVTKSGTYTAQFVGKNEEVKSTFTQQVEINAATGKDITLLQSPSRSYPGDGPFTLVNGIRNNNEKNIQFKKYLGYSGDDLTAMIDMGEAKPIKQVKAWFLHQPGSWIHQPSEIQVYSSVDGASYQLLGSSKTINYQNESNQIGSIELTVNAKQRYIKVLVKNAGQIPVGNPGAGNKPWLFIDEIQLVE
jgi:hexosaminidase